MNNYKKTVFVNISVNMTQAERDVMLKRQTKQLHRSINILPLSAFTDNYIWVMFNQKHCVVIDPGDADVVEHFLIESGLKLSAVLITHHHPDHIGGLPKLLQNHPGTAVFGPSTPKIPLVTHPVKHGDTVYLNNLICDFEVIEIPGHTKDHIAFYREDVLFCGDTLFSVGCGRIFDGDAKSLCNSLKIIQKLPRITKLYPTHEYTLANIAFAKHVEPDNTALIEYEKWAQRQRENHLPTLPTSLSEQLLLNPFLRCQSKSVIQFAKQKNAQASLDETDIFTILRECKDEF